MNRPRQENETYPEYKLHLKMEEKIRKHYLKGRTFHDSAHTYVKGEM